MPVPNQKRFSIVLDRKHDERLDELAERERKSRSQVIRDAIDRMAGSVPDQDDERGRT
jgi:predicted transcriptional regulator